MKNIFYVFFFLGLLGCDKKVDLQLNAQPEKIVLDGYISPQGSRLFITRSTPSGQVMNKDSLFLNDALSILFVGGIPVDTFVNIDSLGHFELTQNDIITVGESYEIKVSVRGLEDVSVGNLLIPESVDSFQMFYSHKTSDEGSIKLNFSVPEQAIYLIHVTGLDSLGIVREISSSFQSDEGECPATWTIQRYFCESKCLRKTNPRIFFNFKYAAYNPYSGGEVNLHRIRYAISLSDESYRLLYEVNDGFDLGYKEPKITKTNVIGGYGAVLPLNFSQAEVVF